MPVTRGGGPVAAVILLQLGEGLQEVEDGADRPRDVLDSVHQTLGEREQI